ncbi:hypothetical protein [uncultured Clostridium sp.]
MGIAKIGPRNKKMQVLNPTSKMLEEAYPINTRIAKRKHNITS